MIGITHCNFLYFSKRDGIWALLSRDHFLKQFGNKLLDEIDVINDEQHLYLAHHDDLPRRSGEFQELIVKLKKIEDTKKMNEMIIIGQRDSVKDLLREVRKKEVAHQSMQSHLRDAWEVYPGDEDAPDPELSIEIYSVNYSVNVH